MISETSASPITVTSIAAVSPVTPAIEAGHMVDRGRLVQLTSTIKRVGHLLRGIAVAPAWHLGAFVETQAVLGLPIQTAFQDQDFLWPRHQQAYVYEPDPFGTEFPFQRDVWPF